MVPAADCAKRGVGPVSSKGVRPSDTVSALTMLKPTIAVSTDCDEASEVPAATRPGGPRPLRKAEESTLVMPSQAEKGHAVTRLRADLDKADYAGFFKATVGVSCLRVRLLPFRALRRDVQAAICAQEPPTVPKEGTRQDRTRDGGQCPRRRTRRRQGTGNRWRHRHHPG